MMSMNAWGEESDSGENVSIDAVTLPPQKGIGSRQREALSDDGPDGRMRSPVRQARTPNIWPAGIRRRKRPETCTRPGQSSQ